MNQYVFGGTQRLPRHPHRESDFQARIQIALQREEYPARRDIPRCRIHLPLSARQHDRKLQRKAHGASDFLAPGLSLGLRSVIRGKGVKAHMQFQKRNLSADKSSRVPMWRTGHERVRNGNSPRSLKCLLQRAMRRGWPRPLPGASAGLIPSDARSAPVIRTGIQKAKFRASQPGEVSR